MRETEEFWASDFGKEYHQRQTVTDEANKDLMARIMRVTSGVSTVAELGAGTGLNLRALNAINPDLWLCGVEINAEAVREILTVRKATAVECSVLEWRPTMKFDLTFTKGLLIHINPADLPKAYATLVRASRRYVMIAEYFNPTPVEVPYRGHAGRLWKRDFAAEIMEEHHLRLVAYGFVYKHGPHAQDNITWFLMEKHP